MAPSEVESLLIKMDNGFRQVFDKIDLVRVDFTDHLLACSHRFSVIDTVMAVERAISEKNARATEDKRDWWKWIIRATVIAVLLENVSRFFISKF